MFDGGLIAAILVGCIVGGFAKGVSGSGLPQVAVPIIALITDVPTAMAVVQLPALSINLLQIRYKDQPASLALQHWPVFLMLFCTTIVGISILRVAPPGILFAFLGTICIATVIFLHLRPDFALSATMRLPVGLPLALIAGLAAGMSSLGGPFLVPYFLSLKLPKDVFVSTVSVCYLAIIIPTISFFLYWDLVKPELFLFSTFAVLPSIAGMWFGNRLRARINDAQFRKFVLLMLLGSATGLIYKSHRIGF